MKIKTIKYVFSVLLIIFTFTSCDKNDISIDESKTTETKDILAFSTMADFEKTLTKVNAMTKEERLSWEKEQGFKSFGTICDEFYETINPKTFKSIDEVEAFVAKNSDKIVLYTNSDGEMYCEPKNYNGLYRNIVGKFEMFIIGNKVYKVIGEELVSTDIENIDKLKRYNDMSLVKGNIAFEIQSNSRDRKLDIAKAINVVENTAYNEGTKKIGSDTYKLKIYLRTTTHRDVADPRNQTPHAYFYYAFRRTEYRHINYARWLAIWWVKRYDSKLSGSITTKDSYDVSQSVNVSLSGECDDSEYRAICNDIYTFIDPDNNSTSYFVSYNITATNTEKDLSVQLNK